MVEPPNATIELTQRLTKKNILNKQRHCFSLSHSLRLVHVLETKTLFRRSSWSQSRDSIELLIICFHHTRSQDTALNFPIRKWPRQFSLHSHLAATVAFRSPQNRCVKKTGSVTYEPNMNYKNLIHLSCPPYKNTCVTELVN